MSEKRNELLRRIEALIAEAPHDREAALDTIVGWLHQAFESFDWTGIYLVDGDHLVLGPYRGKPTEHTRIPIGQGICGAAAASGETEVVDDVAADERYLACFPETRSEIVVPIRLGDEVVGEIDIDSNRPAAFDDADRRFLEEVAQRLADLL